ncbi:MAG: hypothetical protein WCE79_25575 [Xanthobacteraceae bacterium]
MIGEWDLWIIALGILVGCGAPVAFFIVAVATGVNEHILIGIGVSLIALIAWQLDHPFQFLGGIALPVGGFVAFVALSNLKEYLQRGRERGGNR